MPIPDLDSEYLGMSPSQDREDSSVDYIKAYFKNRFERLHQFTQPRAAMAKAQRDFEQRRDAERAAEMLEPQRK